MKNVTVSMEEAVADWARIEAARRNTSVSRLIGEMLAEKMRHDDSYQRARREALEFRSYGSSSVPCLTRDEIYDRGSQANGGQRQLSQGDACAEIRRYQHWKPWAVDQPTVETAWAVESRYGFSCWDALMIAAAQQQQGCTLLLTEDLQHGQQVDSLRVVNPFRNGPELLDAAA